MAEEPQEDDADGDAELKTGTEVGGYVIDSKIGEGGMGVVYGAHQPRIGKRVAIKVLSPQYSNNASAVTRFENEARLVNEIRHPNIVDVFQFGELPDKRSYFVMEWLDGESLSARIERGPLPAAEVVEILDAICDALEAAHEQNVVHRDLKSDNVFLVTKRGKRSVKLLDFGLAKLSGKTDLSSITRTRSGVLVGTPAYMAPEQARGKSVDARTDIYSLGVLSYKMLTGTLPFKADNAMDLIVQHLNAPRPSPEKLAPKTPPALSRLVVRMMAKNPDERPTLLEVRQVFARLRETQQVAPPQAARRATSVLLGLMLFLAGVIALGVIWLIQRNQESGGESPPAAAGSAAAPGGSAAAASAPTPEPPTAPTPTPIVPEPVSSGSAAAAPAPEIEMPADPITGKPKKRRTPQEEEVPVPEPAPVVRPGAILLSIERASQIEIDGVVVAQNSKGGRFDVAPGHHEIRVKAPGRSAVTRSIDVESGGTAVLHVADDLNPSGNE